MAEVRIVNRKVAPGKHSPYGTVGLWYCGAVGLWYCGAVGLWGYGMVVLWGLWGCGCGATVLWGCGTLVLRGCGPWWGEINLVRSGCGGNEQKMDEKGGTG